MPPRLKLTIVEPSDFEGERTRIVESGPFWIGREADNDWVIVDDKRTISRHHLMIDLKSGVFVLTDTSSNGVFLNDAERPVGRGHSAIVSDGDVLNVSRFSIALSVLEREDSARDPFRAMLPHAAAEVNSGNGSVPVPDVEADAWGKVPRPLREYDTVQGGKPLSGFSPDDGMLPPSPLASGRREWGGGQASPMLLSGMPLPGGLTQTSDQLRQELWSRQSESEHLSPERQVLDSASPTSIFIPEDWDAEEISGAPFPVEEEAAASFAFPNSPPEAVSAASQIPAEFAKAPLIGAPKDHKPAFESCIQMLVAFEWLEWVLEQPGEERFFGGDPRVVADRVASTAPEVLSGLVDQLLARASAAISAIAAGSAASVSAALLEMKEALEASSEAIPVETKSGIEPDKHVLAAFAWLEWSLTRPGDECFFGGDPNAVMDKIASTPSAVLSDVTDRLRTRARETIAAIASGQVASINAAVVPLQEDEKAAG
ncbi:FHA domain-containing protein [Pseudochelatococcus contaminans]|uniref:FHA domain-containing protein n=1 Tax=Pseudochelatococcus contaminans TaxID=1538103 RepID=A0A7W6EEH9_9HYPH|nr:FHA domain-containing protein [Pseudochelatococcus contaminans]MBB3808160.1 hypothetical protein [Pseudochelatococcus contaminans]